MAERTVEVVYIPIKAGLDLSVGEAKEAWDYTINTIVKQPGLEAFYWGFQVEHLDIVQMAIEWDSIAAHKAFMADAEYQCFLEKMDKYIQAGPPSMFHVMLAPNRSTTDPFTMPATECLRMWIPTDYPSAIYAARFVQFEDAVAALPNIQAKGLLGGWSVEPARHEALGKGVEGKLFAIFMGWPSLEAHEEFRNMEGFGSIIGLLSEGLSVAEWVHVRFQKAR